MEKSRIEKQFDFIKEIDKEKFIIRQTYLSDARKKENDAEHAWHMAIMTVMLSEYANSEIDVLKTMTMLLIHDEEAKKTQAEREMKAAKRIFGLLPEDQGEKMMNLWLEFENGETAEAKFAHTMDNIQPAMLNDATDGKAWVEHIVHLHSILNRNKNTADGSKKLWEYSRDNFIMPNVEKGRIIND